MENAEKRVIVLYSGGLDSTVLLAMANAEFGAANVIAANIYYGQRHAKEIEYARYQCEKYRNTLIEADLKSMYSYNLNSSALLAGSDKELKLETYDKQISELQGTETVSAYVPFRNGLFLSFAAALALQLNASLILYGAHADDAAGYAYPDCTEEFINYMQRAIFVGTNKAVTLDAPFYTYTKQDIVRVGIEFNVDFSKTWSCYVGGDEPCGECGTCRDRIAALRANNICDIM